MSYYTDSGMLKGQYVDMEAVQLRIVSLSVKSSLYIRLQEFTRHKSKHGRNSLRNET